MNYTPLDWYWLADDSRVFASARQIIVDKTDAAFVARQKTGDFTRWPVDTTDAQTVASMQDVMQPFGLSVPGAPRTATGDALIMALTDTQISTVKPRDQLRISARALIPEDSTMVARAAAKAGTTPKAWFDAALDVNA